MSMKWEIAKSICNKITNKYPIELLKNNFCVNPQTYSLRICNTRDTTSAPGRNNHNGGSGGTGYRIVSKNYETAKKTHSAGGIKFLNFNTEQERYNAWQSYLTKFARFCIMLDESIKLAPYMDDYTEPWTDERFKQYFGLTDIEWQLIDTVIKD